MKTPCIFWWGVFPYFFRTLDSNVCRGKEILGLGLLQHHHFYNFLIYAIHSTGDVINGIPIIATGIFKPVAVLLPQKMVCAIAGLNFKTEMFLGFFPLQKAISTFYTWMYKWQFMLGKGETPRNNRVSHLKTKTQ